MKGSATVALLLMNVLAFGVQMALLHVWRFPAYKYLALNVEGLRHGYVWQLITFQFMHGNVMHLLLNCFAIFIFGREVEEAIGRKNFFVLYLTSGVLGGVFQALAGVLLGGIFAAPVVGASAGAFGLTAAFATLYPEQVLLLFFFIPMKAKYLLVISAALAVSGIVTAILLPSAGVNQPHIADAAHLAGMLTGIAFIRYAMHWHWPWPGARATGARMPRKLVKVYSQKGVSWGQSAGGSASDLPPDEFLEKQVDPILDKISAKGIQSLTEQERRILEAAQKKLRVTK
jgi:membrane associated rhomboid family serine protease